MRNVLLSSHKRFSHREDFFFFNWNENSLFLHVTQITWHLNALSTLSYFIFKLFNQWEIFLFSHLHSHKYTYRIIWQIMSRLCFPRDTLNLFISFVFFFDFIFLNFYSYLFKQVKNNIYCDEEESDDYKKRGEKWFSYFHFCDIRIMLYYLLFFQCNAT